MKISRQQEDRLIRRMKTLFKYIDSSDFYRYNGELPSKIKAQLYSIIEQCHELRSNNEQR